MTFMELTFIKRTRIQHFLLTVLLTDNNAYKQYKMWDYTCVFL